VSVRREGGTTIEDEAAALAEEAAALLPGFTPRGALRRTLKSRLLAGVVDGAEVLLKRLVRRDPHWRWYFAREAALYRSFATEPPPVRAPRLHAALDEHGLLVLELLPGPALARGRRSEDALPAETIAQVTALCDALAAWERGRTAAPARPPSPAARGALRRRLLEDPSDPLGWVREGAERCAQLGVLPPPAAGAIRRALEEHPAVAFAHGDLLPRNLLRVPGGLALVDWECAGLHPAAWDRALLWVSLPAARGALEAGPPGGARGERAAFWACVSFALARELRFRQRSRPRPATAGEERLRAEQASALARLDEALAR